MEQATSSVKMMEAALKEKNKEQKPFMKKVYNWKNESVGMNAVTTQNLKKGGNNNSSVFTDPVTVRNGTSTINTNTSKASSFNSRQTAIDNSYINHENSNKSSYTVSLASIEASKLRSLQEKLGKLKKNTEDARNRTISATIKALEGRKRMYEKRLKNTSKKFLEIIDMEKELEDRLVKQKEMAQYIITNIFKS